MAENKAVEEPEKEGVVKGLHSSKEVNVILILRDLRKSKLEQDEELKNSTSDHQTSSASVVEEKEKVARLLDKLPCSDVAEDIGVMKELWLLTTKSPIARAFLGGVEWCINQLLNRKSVNRSYSDDCLQGKMVSILFQISGNEKSNTKIVKKCPEAMPFLLGCLRSPNIETKLTGVTIVSELLTVGCNTSMIGESGAIRALVEIIKRWEPISTLEAAEAILNLSTSVVEGAIMAVIENREKMLETLEMLSRLEIVMRVLEEKDIVDCLFSVLGEKDSVVREKGKEYCMSIIHAMDVEKINKVENCRQTLESVAITGTEKAKGNAKDVLSWLQDLVDKM